ncbi:septation ring formation regulator EzrA [Heyndrickxia acidicola]|uniref:Septation ring formation regulator EzrA n=1 Tax=Heyndrickxia acidicola TaxID=209389 RepID=A0ABU6MFN4_9BACI|nr:septation ring formation regulator EzrA [Heyndrickxia acidicola]MED1203182.1 septation ring formation regulator EzrA [Heyndrickxia acidicola]
MYYVIGAIVIVLLLLILGYMTRKKYYKEIDKLETWKIEIMNRPVIDEMAKIKQLNMTGQTEDMFEKWRNEWDEIVSVELPNVEELLFEVEENTDKYQFSKAKEVQDKIRRELTNVEAKIETILSELKELVGSEEKNRVEMEDLKTHYKKVKKHLLTHRHQYGKSISSMEVKVDSLNEQFQKYNDLTENGNYLEAREIVISLKSEMEDVLEKQEKIPDLLAEVGTNYPAQIAEIEEGYKEMQDQGFNLEHLQISKEIDEINDVLKVYAEYLEKAEIKEIEEGLQELKEKIDLLYDLLEKEVHAKFFIIQHHNETKDKLFSLRDINDSIRAETEFVKQSYELLNGEMNIPINLEKVIEKLLKRYRALEVKILEDQSAYSSLGESLKEIQENLEEIEVQQKEFSEHLLNLRKDELAAREQISILRKKITDITKMISKSNIPGLPSTYQSLFEEAEERIQDVLQSLNEKPLSMNSVQEYLDIADGATEQLFKKTEELIDNVALAEKIIQYGNRYRRKNQKVAYALREAEQMFRSYDYHGALEEAATALEQVEPGALKKIEKMFTGHPGE